MAKMCLTTNCNTCRHCMAPETPQTNEEETIVNTPVKQTHVVSTDALATLGTIIDATAGRDAIHLAVEPMVAGQKLFPGDNVMITNGKAFRTHKNSIGIVDPFLKGPANEGDYFWLVVHPRTITSLRHVWEHPSFPSADGKIIQTPVDPLEEKKLEAQEFMEDYANQLGETVDTVMEATNEFLTNGDYFYGTDNPGKFEGESLPDEFWDHYEVLTGTVVGDPQKHSFFACSC